MPRNKRGRRTQRVKKWKVGDKRKIALRVHITFNTNESTRIIDPISDERPDIVVYFKFFNPQSDVIDQNREFLKQNLDLINQELPDCKVIVKTMNYIDELDIAEKFSEVIFKHLINVPESRKINFNLDGSGDKPHTLIDLGRSVKEDKYIRITINLTGSKLVCIIAYFLAQLWHDYLETNNIDIDARYVYSDNFDMQRKEGAHIGEMKCSLLPKLSFKVYETRILLALYAYQFVRFENDAGFRENAVYYRIFDQMVCFVKNAGDNVREDIDLNQSSLIKRLKALSLIEYPKNKSVSRSESMTLTPQGVKSVKFACTYYSPILEDMFSIESERFPENFRERLRGLDLPEPGPNVDGKCIYVVFNRKEEERIIDPVREIEPFKMIYFYFKKGKRMDIYYNILESNCEKIERIMAEKGKNIEILKEPAEYVSFFEIIGNVAQKIGEMLISTSKSADPNKYTFVLNIATGSRLTSIALMAVYHYWYSILNERTNIRLQYIYNYSDNYDPSRKGATHQGSMKYVSIPELPIIPPDEGLIAIIFKLREFLSENPKRSTTKSFLLTDFIRHLKKNKFQGLEFLFDNKSAGIGDKDDNSERYISQKIREKYFKQLQNWRFIEERKKEGKSYRIRLSDDIEHFWRIFDLFKGLLISNG